MFLDYDKYPDAEPYYVQTIRRVDPKNPKHPGNYYHHPFFLIMDMSAQISSPQNYVLTADDVTALDRTADHTATMSIDYVRLYQNDDPDNMLIYKVPGDKPSLDIEETVDTPDEGEPIYYDLSGRKVLADTPGVLIRRQGDKVTKILNCD